MTYDLRSHILGGLYGQALGDAMGMPAYFDPEQTISAYGWIDSLLPAPDDHEVHAGLPAGRITDDSEQAFSLARAYIDAGGVTVEATIAAVLAWYERTGGDQSRYVGPSTRRAVQALKAGAEPMAAGRTGDTNGASMRVSVVGLIHAGHPMAAIEAAYTSCIATHGTNVAISGACAIAAAVAVAAHPDATVDAVIAAGLLGAELGRKRGTVWIGASVAKKIEQAVKIARTTANEDDALRRFYHEVGTSLATPETVGSAFGCFALAMGNPVQAAIYGANASGDADTVAAIAAAIAGAYCGIEAIPAELVSTLEADPVFASYSVRELADGIHAMASRPYGVALA